MEMSVRRDYNHLDSFSRIDEILDAPWEYEERDTIPSRNDLTYNNGFYVQCNAIFIDIRDSSSLPDKYRRPTLAKIYRSYISEMVAILNGYATCKEVNIVGDSVSGIFEATSKDQTMDVFQAGYTACSLMDVLNYKLCRKGIDSINFGVGIAKGRALMIQAGYKGSGLNDVVWMGDVVNEASNLCALGGSSGVRRLVIAPEVFNDLAGKLGYNDVPYQSMFQYLPTAGVYHGHLERIDMHTWLRQQPPCSR